MQRSHLNAFRIRSAILGVTVLGIMPLCAELVALPKQVGTAIDIGQAFKDHKKEPMTRTGVYLTAGGVYDDKLEVVMTTGGLFWYGFPELSSSARTVKFGPGIGQAQASYKFGNPSDPSSVLQFGLFPMKYNPDATNLGEYLFRSGTYPGYIWTGGWSYINSASYMAEGLHWQLKNFDGALTHDFTLFMERDAISPNSDFSPGYVVTGKLGSAFEVGGGVVWSNALSFNPHRLTPKTRENAYDTQYKKPLSGLTPDDPAYNDSANWTYYTFRGFKVMARASMDIGSLMGMEKEETGTFKLYTEAALLGVKDQPYYYERKADRIPVMAGISVPTFGLLDNLSIEVEHYGNRYPNTIYFPFDSQQNLPLPLDGGGDQRFPSQFSDSAFAADKKKFTKDDWKWSVLTKRQITEGISLYLQVASDHLRQNNVEAKFSNKPYTETPSDWYYVLRLDFGLF